MLRSPHTVDLYDFGTSESGSLYYAMELLDGVDLETLIRTFGPQPPERVVHWLSQACHSLHEAHSQKLVHRDIKPSNLFVCRYGLDVDFLKVLDFGLVAVQATLPDARLTGKGEIKGTPAYMAPEVVTGECTADARSDIYALGCVAYWCLTGRIVFQGASTLEVMVAHAVREPEAPSVAACRSIPLLLEEVVLHCLRKNPAQRPQSALELAQFLENAVKEKWTTERARNWWETNMTKRSRISTEPAEASLPSNAH